MYSRMDLTFNSPSFSLKDFVSQIFAFMDVEGNGVITFKQVIEHPQALSLEIHKVTLESSIHVDRHILNYRNSFVYFIFG